MSFYTKDKFLRYKGSEKMNKGQDKKTLLLNNDNVKKSLTLLAMPSILAMLTTAIYSFVDVIFIGRLNNTLSMGAVSIGYPLFIIITAIGLMIGLGASSYISRNLGKGDKLLSNKTASIGIALAVIVSIIITIVCSILLKPILTLMGSTTEVMPYAVEYSRWLVFGSGFTIINMVLNNIIRSEGNAKYSMIGVILAAVLNIALDPVFIFGFNMGVAGASFATLVAQAIATLFLASYFIRGKGTIKIDFKLVNLNIFSDKEVYFEILKIGSPVFIMQFFSSITFSLLNSVAITYGGDSMIAAMAIVNKINMVPSYIFMGFVQGLQPYAAYNYGAKMCGRLNDAIKFSIVVLLAASVVFLTILQLFPGAFIGLFTKDPSVYALGINYLKGVTLLLPAVAITILYTYLFQSLGKAKEAAILTLGRQAIVLIPVVLILPKIFVKFSGSLGFIKNILPYEVNSGLYGVIYAQATTDLITLFITGFLAISLYKKISSGATCR